MRAIGWVATLGLTVLAGCAVPKPQQPPEFQVGVPFDQAAARRSIEPGPNTVRGSALLRQRGGGIVSCAGLDVRLIPDTEYASRRMSILYASEEAGFISISMPLVRFAPDLPEYMSTTRVAKCDAQGNFVFERVADGSFFVVTRITWGVGYSTEGGSLMKRVSVSGGQSVHQVLSQ